MDIPSTSKFTIYTSMGRSGDWSKLGLTKDQVEILNDIGYGTNKKYSSFSDYLNTLDSFKYIVRRISSDTGGFSETFEITRVRSIENDNNNNSYTGYLSDIVEVLSKQKDLYVTVTVTDASEVLKKKEKQAKIEEKEKLLIRLKQLNNEISEL